MALGSATPAPANAAPMEAYSAQLAAAVRTNRETAAGDVERARRLGNSRLEADYRDRARDRLASEVSGLALSAALNDPERTGAVAAAAVRAAPEVAAEITRALVRSLPGRAGEILAATGGTTVERKDAPRAGPRDYTPSQLTPASPVRAAPLTASPAAHATIPVPSPDAPPPAPGPGPEATAPATAPRERSEAPVPSAAGAESINDPVEGLNRAIFAFNDGVDTMVFRPVAAVYGYVIPDAARSAVRRAFDNLNLPVVFANDLFQLDLLGAGITLGRFAINSTVGALGLFDVAQHVGFDAHRADFGQTLHHYGSGPGAYVVLPLIGPSTVRDAVGKGVDGFLQPLRYIVEPEVSFAVSGAEAVVRREALLVPLDDLKSTSVDYYAALRAAYYQNRAVDLRKGRAADSPDVDAMFDAAE
jgi:phospholipid-binding lipoprotein MlaA